MNVEVPVDDVRKEAVGLVGICVLSNPVVGGSAVKLRVEESPVPLAVEEGARKECFEAIVETAAVRDSALVGDSASGFGGKVNGIQIATSLCDHVDERDKRSRAIDRGIRSTNDLNSLDQCDIDR